MRILSVDTTGETGSVALVGERGVIEELALYIIHGLLHLNGWDDIGLTMRHEKKISDYEAQHKQNQPWI